MVCSNPLRSTRQPRSWERVRGFDDQDAHWCRAVLFCAPGRACQRAARSVFRIGRRAIRGADRAPITLDDALALVQPFVDPILADGDWNLAPRPERLGQRRTRTGIEAGTGRICLQRIEAPRSTGGVVRVVVRVSGKRCASCAWWAAGCAHGRRWSAWHGLAWVLVMLRSWVRFPQAAPSETASELQRRD
jgi:hypothetical protein